MKSIQTVESARSIILEEVKRLSPKLLPLQNAYQHVLSQDIVAKEFIPAWNNSAVDGYAVKSHDVRWASRKKPYRLNVIEKVLAGDFSKKEIRSGSAIEIMTGAPLPQGADAVVMVEDTKKLRGIKQKSENRVNILKAVRKWENVRKMGKDVSFGQTVFKSGDILDSASVGVCASLGYAALSVIPKPVVSILSTGNELVKVNDSLFSGKIRDSNSWILKGLAEQLNAKTLFLGIVPDDPNKLIKFLKKGFSESDAVITSGGVSVGTADYIKRVLRTIGAKVHIRKIAMKPGKPLLFATYQGKPFFGLPGNPVSSFVTFQLFVRPALLKMMGQSPESLPKLFAKLENQFDWKSDRRSFLRGKVEQIGQNKYSVKILQEQGSHQLAALSQSNCLIDVPAGEIFYPKGKIIPVILLGHFER